MTESDAAALVALGYATVFTMLAVALIIRLTGWERRKVMVVAVVPSVVTIVLGAALVPTVVIFVGIICLVIGFLAMRIWRTDGQ